MAEASTSRLQPNEAADPKICSVCAKPAAYKCPRCLARTCSSACGKKHKEDAKCSGERDKAAYVKPTDFGYGVLMSDYQYLETVERAVHGFLANRPQPECVRPEKGKGVVNAAQTRDWIHLAARHGISVVLLQDGMERRTVNQTRAVNSKRNLMFTITISAQTAHDDDVDITKHNIRAEATPTDICNKCLSDSRSKRNTSKRLATLANAHKSGKLVFLMQELADPVHGFELYRAPRPPTPPPPEAPDPLPPLVWHPSLPNRPGSFSTLPARPASYAAQSMPTVPRAGLIARPQFAAASQPNTAVPETAPQAPVPKAEIKAVAPKRRYRRLDPQQPLLIQLKRMTIIEWPVIEVWELSEYTLQLKKQELDVYDVDLGNKAPPAKRAKGTLAAAPIQKPVSMVCADYGTDSDEEEATVSQLLMAS